MNKPNFMASPPSARHVTLATSRIAMLSFDITRLPGYALSAYRSRGGYSGTKGGTGGSDAAPPNRDRLRGTLWKRRSTIDIRFERRIDGRVERRRDPVVTSQSHDGAIQTLEL